MSCRYTLDDGAYVLGALSPAERIEFEKHLPHCDECTRAVGQLAGLPGLLGRVDPSQLEEGTPADDSVPDTLLPRLAREARHARRRRMATTAAAAAVAAASLVVALVVTQGAGEEATAPSAPTAPATSPSSPAASPRQMDPVGEVPVRADLSLEPVTWGTRLGLTCTYDAASVPYELPPEVDYTLVVRTRDGRTEQVGSWRSVSGKTMQLSAGTATSRDDIAAVEVRSPGVGVVLTLAP